VLEHLLCQHAGGSPAEGWDVVAITGVETLVDGGWNVHLGREMAVCLIVIPGGELLCTSPCVNPRERELARKREPEHENECGKRREKYHGKK
jgi:hypothetical protein